MKRGGKSYRWCSVPAGTPQARCRDCQSPVYWVTGAYGARVLIDCDVQGLNGKQPTPEEHGQGIPHLDVCPARQARAAIAGGGTTSDDEG